ncbi:inverse autotransporter beta domain-containing protein, partial [Salmonella enterica]|uniref:inverse autotransporter beta domain-containing protein n=1 Tax=Salmonella enterica TaxID=28901 RepID=UPI003730170A
ASTAGSLLKGPHPGQAAASMAEGMARGMALGKANQTLQDWFRHLGNARVQLNADSDFSLKNSAFDLLHPWWETPDNMLFSQGSLHRTDHRSQANLGFGWRHWTTGTAPRGLFHGDYMTGLNTFLDYDLSRDHARMGIGAEFWRDYLKMDANLYHRLTNWKNSPDLDDYEERPADGWDLRMEGWLPSYPQLGAKLEYEQYYGNQVALFDTDHLQSNPRAVTTDLTWTPFPLMTVSAGRRQGQNSL